MRDVMQVTGYFHAAYIVAAVIYIGYIVSLSRRARRAAGRARGSIPT
jgi:hypothetical protein